MDLKAVGNYLVLKCVPEEEEKDKVLENGLIIPAKFNKKSTGIVINLPSKDGKLRVDCFVHSIGGGVDQSKYNFSVGDEVVVNDYDIQTYGDEENNIWALCKVESVKAVVSK